MVSGDAHALPGRAPSVPAALLARIRELDAAHPSLVIASVNAQGAPHATHTFFAWEFNRPHPSLLVTVLAHSAKMANLRADPRVAFTIGGALPDLWLNGHGRAVVLDGDEAARGLVHMLNKTPAVASFTSRLPTGVVRIVVNDLTVTDTRDPAGPLVRLVYPESPAYDGVAP